MPLDQRRLDAHLRRHLAGDHPRRTNADDHNIVVVLHADLLIQRTVVRRQLSDQDRAGQKTAPAVPAPVCAPITGPTTYSTISSMPSSPLDSRSAAPRRSPAPPRGRRPPAACARPLRARPPRRARPSPRPPRPSSLPSRGPSCRHRVSAITGMPGGASSPAASRPPRLARSSALTTNVFPTSFDAACTSAATSPAPFRRRARRSPPRRTTPPRTKPAPYRRPSPGPETTPPPACADCTVPEMLEPM